MIVCERIVENINRRTLLGNEFVIPLLFFSINENELLIASEKVDMNNSKTYVLEDQSKHEIPNDVVLKYIGSWIYDNLIDLGSRDGNRIDTGYPLKYFGEIVKYMKNEYDVNELNDAEFDELVEN